MQKTDLPLLALAFFFLFGLLLLSSYKPAQEEEGVKECEEKATRKCYVGNCVGEQQCVGNQWSECRLNIVCVPGTIQPCIVDYCARTYKVCDECGSGYGECLPRQELPFAIKPAPPP